VAFHVEIGRGHRTAREFNLDDERLRQLVLEPWARGRELRMGDRDWLPAECRLTILEGPELSGPDLAFGRGWDRAQRTGRNVTRELVTGAARSAWAVAVLAETHSGGDAVMAALRQLGVESLDWAAIRESALGAERDPSGGQASGTPAAVVLALESAEPRGEWLYEAGVAVGAMAGRALVARLGPGAVPPALAGLPAVDPADDLTQALAAGLGLVATSP
jgi:hypothetical protein